MQTYPLTQEPDADSVEQMYFTRAAAHARDRDGLRAAQRWHDSVTDQGVALVMYAIERGVQLRRNRMGRWLAPAGSPISSGLPGWNVSTIVSEMIRTGLLRHLRPHQTPDNTDDVLIPALVHLRLEDHSACLFTGEDLGPMRARLVDDLTLVDCLACEQTVASGHVRGL
jgi:hypothetical protein